MKIINAAAVFLSFGLSNFLPAQDIDPFEGFHPFFVHRTAPGGFAADTHTGFYCYAIEREQAEGGTVVAIMVVENNEVIESISHGSNNGDLM